MGGVLVVIGVIVAFWFGVALTLTLVFNGERGVHRK